MISVANSEAKREEAGHEGNPVIPEFTGVVVTYNEITHLEECLKRIAFCREIVVVDMGSTDGSAELAKSLGARVVHHERVPVVEMVRAFAVSQAVTDWVVFLDPDIMFQPAVLDEAVHMIAAMPDLGLIEIPQRNHFKKKPVRHGRWGGITWHPVFFHRERVGFRDGVHRGIRLHAGFRGARTAVVEGSIMTHYWADSWRKLTAKARRYLVQEGKTRFDAGERTRARIVLANPFRAFWYAYVTRQGMRDGLLGLELSLFWAWYSGRSELGLYLQMMKEQTIFTHHGARFLRIMDDELVARITRGKPFEEKELGFLEAFLRPGHTYWDVGANFGLHAILAARKVGSNGSVVAFEPDPTNRKRLTKNVELNLLENMKIIPAAVGAEETDVSFVVCTQGAYSGLKVAKVPGRTRHITVRQTTLDATASLLGWPRVDLCQMDVEGAEILVCRGGEKFFGEITRPVVMCEFDDQRAGAYEFKAKGVYDWFLARRYTWYQFADSGRLREAPPEAEYIYSNLIGCPREKLARVAPFMESEGGSHA